MLESLKLDQFTVFEDQTLEFTAGVNVLIGENGSGKSHLLKLAYSLARVSQEAGDKASLQNLSSLQKRLAEKLVAVFRPDQDAVGRLVRRIQGRNSCRVELAFAKKPQAALRFSFSTQSKNDVTLESLPPEWMGSSAIFLPTKEVLSMFPGFAGLYRNREIAIDETYYDLCVALDVPPLRGARLEKIRKPLELIETAMGGTVDRAGDQFYLQQTRGGKVEMPLVAEGVRKLATVAQLIRTGSLSTHGAIFWDEPESNLNPRLLRAVAAVLAVLAQQGIQVIVATHSFFLMKELELLRRQRAGSPEAFSTRFFSLSFSDTASSTESATVRIEAGDRLRDIEGIVALEEELAQFDREQEISLGHH